jgi:hypothetical protein
MEQKYIKYKNEYVKAKIKNNMDVDKMLQKIEFPFYNLFFELDVGKFREMVNKNDIMIVKKYQDKIINKFDIAKFDDGYLFIELNWQKTNELDMITDYFTEPCRIQCNTLNNMSPKEYWDLNRDNVMVNNGHQLNKMRDYVYKKSGMCSGFRVSVALAVLKIFGAKKWLDISAGWGDRLVAAIGHGVEMYCGVDPNLCLHPYYNQIVDTLDKENKHKYVLIKDGFETARLPNEKFDLVFSSPPFFDVEIYSKNEGDSMTNYSTGDSWYNNFLMPSIKKANENLEIGGNLVLYIGEGKTYKYLDKMVADVSKFMDYRGKFFYYYDDKFIAKRFFVWKKREMSGGRNALCYGDWVKYAEKNKLLFDVKRFNKMEIGERHFIVQVDYMKFLFIEYAKKFGIKEGEVYEPVEFFRKFKSELIKYSNKYNSMAFNTKHDKVFQGALTNIGFVVDNKGRLVSGSGDGWSRWMLWSDLETMPKFYFMK